LSRSCPSVFPSSSICPSSPGHPSSFSILVCSFPSTFGFPSLPDFPSSSSSALSSGFPLSHHFHCSDFHIKISFLLVL
jgi:hypothetical protein